jgi:hypothetical protein
LDETGSKIACGIAAPPGVSYVDDGNKTKQ